MKALIHSLSHYLRNLDDYLNKQKALDLRWKKEDPIHSLRYPRGEFPRMEISTSALSQDEKDLLKLIKDLILYAKNADTLLNLLNPYLRQRVYLNDKPDRIDQIYENVKQEKAVLYSDIRGFTRSSAERGSAFNVSHDLAKYFSEVFPISLKHSGQIEYLAGDAQIVSFLNPYDALDTALETMKKVYEIGQRIGIGLNYGEVYYPDLGCEYIKVHTIIGDAVNMTQRCEELTKKFNTPIIGTLEFWLALQKTSRSRIGDVFYREFMTDLELRGAIQSKRLFDFWPDEEKKLNIQFYHESSKELMKVLPNWNQILKLLTQAVEYSPGDGLAAFYLNYAKEKIKTKLKDEARQIISDDEIRNIISKSDGNGP